MDIIMPALTYNGSVFDTVLNTMVFLVLVAAFAIRRESPSWIMLVVMAALQVSLWFALGATGFSVVWSGLAGAAVVNLVAEHRLNRRPSAPASKPDLRWAPLAAVIVAFAAMAYYAVALPPISTVAHLLAFGLGAGIHVLTEGVAHRMARRHTLAVRAALEGSAPLRLPERLHQHMLEKWPDYNEGDQWLQYGIWGDAGLRISRDTDGYLVERRSDRSNTYDQFRFRTMSRRDLERRLLQE